MVSNFISSPAPWLTFINREQEFQCSPLKTRTSTISKQCEVCIKLIRPRIRPTWQLPSLIRNQFSPKPITRTVWTKITLNSLPHNKCSSLTLLNSSWYKHLLSYKLIRDRPSVFQVEVIAVCLRHNFQPLTLIWAQEAFKVRPLTRVRATRVSSCRTWKDSKSEKKLFCVQKASQGWLNNLPSRKRLIYSRGRLQRVTRIETHSKLIE